MPQVGKKAVRAPQVKLTKEMVLKLNPYPPASLGVANKIEEVILMPRDGRVSNEGRKTTTELKLLQMLLRYSSPRREQNGSPTAHMKDSA